jgi:hypothetical protein
MHTSNKTRVSVLILKSSDDRRGRSQKERLKPQRFTDFHLKNIFFVL